MVLREMLEIPINFIVRRVLVNYLGVYLPDFLLTRYSVWGDRSKVIIAPTAHVANTLFNVSSGKIVIEDYVCCGHNVCIITGTHDWQETDLGRISSVPQSGRDVIVKRGAWIASNVTILGPCIIGENSVVGAGCLISRDVPPNTICFSGNSLVMKEIEQTLH